LAKLGLDQHDDRGRRLDPTLGLVSPSTGHSNLTSAHIPFTARLWKEMPPNRGFRPEILGAIGAARRTLFLLSVRLSKGFIGNGEDQGGEPRRRNGRRRDDT